MKKPISILIKVSIAAIILLFLFRKIGISKIVETISKTTHIQIFISIAYVLMLIILGALNFALLLKIIKRKIKFIILLKCYVISWSIGFFSPGKIGEFSIVYLLKKRGVPFGEGSAIAIIEKLESITSLAIMGLLGLIIFEKKFTLEIITLVTIALIITSTLVISNKFRYFIRKYILRGYAKLFNGFSGAISEIKKNPLIIISLLAVSMKFIITALATKMVFQIYSINIPFLSVLAITAITSLVAFIPISISGLGVRESIAVYLYKQIGVNSAYALTTQLIFTIFVYLIAALMLIWRVNKLNKREKFS